MFAPQPTAACRSRWSKVRCRSTPEAEAAGCCAPREIACYDPDTRKVVIGRGNVAMESCWAAGKLAFERQSLGEICRYMARWYDTEIHITPALAHNYAYTFTLTDEPLEAILRIMSRINPIAYTFAEDNTVTISELE